MPRVPEEVLKVKVDALSLDLNNYRFVAEQPDEAMAFNYLFEKEDVMSVAYSLLREGYRTNEVPLVVVEDGRYVVLEANRRISALRALRNPSLVPNHRDALERLIRRHQTDVDELPDEIYVTVYPDRAAAAPVLARQHIGVDKKRWGRDEQAKFVIAQLAGGADVKTLRSTLTGIKDVVRLVRMGRVRQALKETHFSDPDLAAYVNGPDLKMSAFEYAYRDRSIRPLLGFEFDDEGNVVSRPTSPGQMAVLERLLRGFKSRELSTRRVLNDKKSEAYGELIEELRALAGGVEASASSPADGPSGTPGATASTVGGTPPTAGAAAGPQLPPDAPARVGSRSPGTRNTLHITVDYSRVPAGLQKRFDELGRIQLDRHPAAAAMLLRSVVESSIKHHYAQKSDYTVSGTLGDVASRLEKDYRKTYRALQRPIDLLRNTVSPRTGPGSTDWFNHASHDPNMVVKADDVRDAWQELEPLVRFLIQPSAQSSS